jgi:hypothetical protein
MRTRTLATAIALAGACALPGAALAAPGWTSPINFPAPGNAYGPTVSVAYQTGGTATIAYLEAVSLTVPIKTVLHVGVLAPGGSYQEQLQIPSTATSTPGLVKVAEAPDGAAVVEWGDLLGTDPSTDAITYLASYRAAGSSTWEAPTTIATDSVNAGTFGSTLVPALATDGTAAAGVQHIDSTIAAPGGERLDVAVRPQGGAWGAATQISQPHTDSDSLALAFDSQDDLTASFRTALSPTRHALGVATRAASNGVWAPAQNITGVDFTSDVGPPALGEAPDGSAVIAFQFSHLVAPVTLDVNAVVRAGPTGAWSSPVDVVPGGTASASGALAAGVSATGREYILYSFAGSSSTQDCVGVVRAPSGGAFGAPRCISPLNLENSDEGAMTLIGNDAYFAWIGKPNAGTNFRVQGSRWLDGAAAPDLETDLDPPVSSVQLNELVPDQDGSVLVLWTNPSNTARSVAFDAGGPNLTSASIPATGLVGQALSMSAGFADLWAGLGGDASWSFGDGSTATGPQVTHTYAHPGTYTITVTAADKLGNTTTSTYTTTITPATPTLTNVSQTARTWSEHKLRRHGHKKPPPVGTTFKFTLNEPATVKLVFTHKLTGRRVNHKCKPPTKHNKHDPRCTHTITDGTITIPGQTGANSYKFTGKIGKHKLAAGTHKVALTATNSSNQRSTTTTLTFHITN